MWKFMSSMFRNLKYYRLAFLQKKKIEEVENLEKLWKGLSIKSRLLREDKCGDISERISKFSYLENWSSQLGYSSSGLILSLEMFKLQIKDLFLIIATLINQT